MKFLATLFGCGHARTSRVFTIDDVTYVVCLECGREFEYDLATMQRGPEIDRPVEHADPVAVARRRKQQLVIIHQQPSRFWSEDRAASCRRTAVKD